MSKGYGHFGFDLAYGVMEKNGLPWAVGMLPIMTCDWKNVDWTIPLNLDISPTVNWWNTPVVPNFINNRIRDNWSCA
jgi:hypothetical protein